MRSPAFGDVVSLKSINWLPVLPEVVMVVVIVVVSTAPQPTIHSNRAFSRSLTRDYLVGVGDHLLAFFIQIVRFVARFFAHRVGRVTFLLKVISHHVAELFLIARIFVFDGGRGSVEYSAVCDCDVLFSCEVQKMRKQEDMKR